jgi:tetratricopeptide (TPR) repeat protein
MLAAGQEREVELEGQCEDVPARADGSWTAKDQLAHLAYWRARNARLLEAVRAGGDLPPSVDDEDQNAIVYAQNRDRPLADIQKDARASWPAMRAFVEKCTEEDLLKAHPYAPEYELWETVTGVIDHLAAHLISFHMERGDRERAKVTQVWAYTLANQVFSQPAQQADAAYNLACFYSRVGRLAEAVPLLRQSLEAKPALIAHARQDPDLDPIRDHPDLAALLAT